MNRSTPGLPVHHHLPEFTQTHVHRVRDAIQPSHPQSSPSPPAPNPSQHQSLFQWVNSSHEVAKVLVFQLQKIRPFLTWFLQHYSLNVLLCWMLSRLSHVQLWVTPWTIALQALLSMGFNRQEYWRRLPFPSPGDLPDPGTKPKSPALQTHLCSFLRHINYLISGILAFLFLDWLFLF